MSEERAKEAVNHLQTAALELIAATRVVLDVAEDVVRDPQQAAEWLSMLASAGKDGAPSEPGEPRVTKVEVS